MILINQKRFFGMLGFAMRAGKVIIGTESICSSLQKKNKSNISLILVSNAASDGTKKKLLYKTEFYEIPFIEANIDMSELGRTLGKTFAPAAIAVTDIRFAEEIRQAFAEESE